MTTRRGLHCALGALSLLAIGHDARADSVAPLEVSVVGDGAVRVRIASGYGMPCDATINTVLANTVVKPGTPLVIKNEDICVCWEQTFAPYTETGWSTSALACRPAKCTGAGRARRCTTDMTAPFRLAVSSKRESRAVPAEELSFGADRDSRSSPPFRPRVAQGLATSSSE